MDKIKATNILEKNENTNIVEVNLEPGYFLDTHTHDWNVDIIILKGSLQVNFNNKVKLLFAGDRFKPEKKTEHTEFSGIEGVSFLSARPSRKMNLIF